MDVLGSEYYAMTYQRNAEVGVVATDNDTIVNITLTTAAAANLAVSYNGATYTSGDTICVTLNK